MALSVFFSSVCLVLGIDVLLKYRSESVGISAKNLYMFPKGSMTLSHLRGPDVLRSISEVEALEKPDLITSTKLRKYVATVCQVFDLSENEYDWLARHLGHNIKVHREFYRLHEDVVELTKVSRLLMAVDTGEANKFVGKQLKEINLTDLPAIGEEDEEDEEGVEGEVGEEGEVVEERERGGKGEMEHEEDGKHFHTALKKDDIQGTSKLNTSVGTIDHDNTDTDVLLNPVNKVSAKNKTLNKSRRFFKRIPWNADDKKTVVEYFRPQIKRGIVPGKSECEACQATNESLKNRKWTDIKFCIKNHISKMKKMRKI